MESSINVDEMIDLDSNEDTQTDNQATGVSSSKGHIKRKRKLTSRAWDYFTKLPAGINEKPRARCNKCGTTYNCDSKNGTGNLLIHMNVCQKRESKDVGQLLMSILDSGLSLRSSKFSTDKFRELVTYAIIKHDLPFQFVEYEGIRDIFKYISEDIKLVSRNTAKADVLQLYEIEKARMRKMLQSVPGRICLTSDLWTSIATDGYISLTAHFIDDDWKLQKRILNFQFMPTPHTGVAMGEKVYKLLREWGIEKRIFSITLDNASANDVFVAWLKQTFNLSHSLVCKGDFFHIRCCAHILNLIVHEGLKEIDASVVKVRDSVKYFRGSQMRRQRFLECVKQTALDSKRGLRQDVPTRWNSTYLMLANALYYKPAFVYLKTTDSNFIHCPSDEEWILVEKICDFLAVFYNVTCVFSGTMYATSNLYFPQVFVVQHTLKKMSESTDSRGYVQRMAAEMKVKFDKYWSRHCLILAIAVIFDPRYKLQFVEWSYSRLYGDNSEEMELVCMKLKELFTLYHETHSKEASSSHVREEDYTGNISSMHTSKESIDVMKDFDSFESTVISSERKSQLQLYLDEPRMNRNESLNVLDFWNANKFRYPELSLLARDILSIPISTVASESAFSIGGRVIDAYRSSLKPEVAEALLCSREWLYNKKIDEENLEPNLEELTEDIINLNLSDGTSKSAQSSNSTSLNS